MKSYTRFIKNYIYNTNHNSDGSDNQMKAGFPINQILQESSIKEQKQLENYGIPAGLVLFNNKHSLNNIYGGGEGGIISEKKDLVISDDEYDKLFEMVSYKKKKNKTMKKQNSLF